MLLGTSLIDLARDIQTACIWEVTARKAGNVHRFADFSDLTYLDFIFSAAAIAPVLKAQRDSGLGIAILKAIRATGEVVRTNANLGIVLLLAPLSRCESGRWRHQLDTMLEGATVADAKYVYEAIRLAKPGGLGKVDQQDIAQEPTVRLRAAMVLAADRDLVARQYANGFEDVLNGGVPALLSAWDRFKNVEAAILQLQLHLLSHYADSLIVRKRGQAEADEVMRRAIAIDLSTEDGRQQYREFDRWLRMDGHARNPGTTADLVTACLFVALRERRMDLSMPFSWDNYV